MSETETAAAYIRVSTEQQKEEDSHIRQRDRMQQWADDHGTDVEFFEDIAISGQSDERDAYDELLDSYHDYDYVVVRELSRFGRDPVAVLQDVEDIAESDGTEFVSVTEPMLDTTSAHGKLMIRLIASINGFHADLRREQAQRMVERRKEKGLPVGRPDQPALQLVLDGGIEIHRHRVVEIVAGTHAVHALSRHHRLGQPLAAERPVELLVVGPGHVDPRALHFVAVRARQIEFPGDALGL